MVEGQGQREDLGVSDAVPDSVPFLYEEAVQVKESLNVPSPHGSSIDLEPIDDAGKVNCPDKILWGSRTGMVSGAQTHTAQFSSSSLVVCLPPPSPRKGLDHSLFLCRCA